MGISNTLMRQLKANSQLGTDMGSLINMTFNSIILCHATTFGLDPTKATLRQAVNVYQSNEYIKMFDVPIEYQQTPSMVKQWCIENSKIGANEYPFPKVSAKDLENWNQGKVYRYSEKQLAFINREYLRGELEFAEGSIRAGKSLCMRARKTLHFLGNHGSRHALVAYSYSSARRLMLDSEAGFLETIPMAREIKGQEQTRLVFKSLLYPYEDRNVYVISAHDKKSASAIVGMDLDTIFAEEFAHLNGEAMEQLNQRCAHSPHKLISLCSNPIGMDAGLLAFLRLFTGVDQNGKQVMDTENSHHRYVHTTFRMEDNVLMAENPELIEAVKDEYRFDQTLYNEKVLGKRSQPKGLVLAQFKEPQHVLDTLTKDVNPRTLELFASADFGYSDTTAVLFYLKYIDHMGRPHATVIASYSHAVHKYCTMKNVSVGDLSPQEHIQNILSCWIRIKRALSAYYPEKIYGTVRNGSLLIDPSNKAEINQLSMMLESWGHMSELAGMDVRKADNNSAKKSIRGNLMHTPSTPIKTGAELGFANINRSFYMNRLDFLRDPSSLNIDDLENAHTINEVQVYQRKPDGSLILQGKDHLDAVHSLRYGHNHLQSDFFGSYE